MRNRHASGRPVLAVTFRIAETRPTVLTLNAAVCGSTAALITSRSARDVPPPRRQPYGLLNASFPSRGLGVQIPSAPHDSEERGDERAAGDPGPGARAGCPAVAATDVARASGVVCTGWRPGHGAARFVTKVWPADATTNAILELTDHLAGIAIEKVVLESTPDYWRPFSTCWKRPGWTWRW